jgi:hypothetical protein
MFDLISRLIEKLLSSILVSFLLVLLSFSYFSGHMPPRKDDLFRSITLIKMMISSSQDYNAKAKSYASLQSLSLDQVAELQRLALKRTEISLELLKIYKKLQFGVQDPAIDQKLRDTDTLLESAGKNLEDVNQKILRKNQWLNPPQGSAASGQ